MSNAIVTPKAIARSASEQLGRTYSDKAIRAFMRKEIDAGRMPFARAGQGNRYEMNASEAAGVLEAFVASHARRTPAAASTPTAAATPSHAPSALVIVENVGSVRHADTSEGDDA